jgi:hypothetical protein
MEVIIKRGGIFRMRMFLVRTAFSVFCLFVSVVMIMLIGCEKNGQVFVYPANDSCSIDDPKPGQKFSREKPIVFWGWAVDAATGVVPEQVEVYLLPQTRQGGIKTVPNRDLPRQDVADYFKKPNFVKAGITGKLDVSSLAPGTYNFVVLQTDGQRKLYCVSPAVISIE